MPRTAVTPITSVGPYPTLPPAADSLDLTMTAIDTVNANQATFGSSPKMLAIFWNSGASIYTVTLTSVVDPFNRTGDITAYSLGIGELMSFMVDRQGWAQTDNNFYFTASNAAVKCAIIKV